MKDVYEFDELKACRLAIFHDYPEHLLSDIPHTCKKRLPLEFNKILEDLEVDIIRTDLNEDLAIHYKELLEMSSVEGLVVALADAYSVILFSNKEVLLGNKEYYENNVIPYTVERIDKIKILLKPYLIKK